MLWVWIGFFVVVLLLLALDLGVFHRDAHVLGFREATSWTLFWVAISLAFNASVYFIYEYGLLDGAILGAAPMVGGGTGGESAMRFFTGYLLEKALSVDNIFVIAMLFTKFRVEPQYQHRVLFWGILGAIISRSLMIGFGVWLVTRFSWVFYIFGGYLAYAGIKLLLQKEEKDFDPGASPILRLVGKLVPIHTGDHQQRFVIRGDDGVRRITSLMLALIVIEITDVLFAFDSVPAVLAITTDTFIVLTSNIFAILGLRALYFVLASMLDRFRYLKTTLAAILIIIGAKMLLHHVYQLPTTSSLIIIGSLVLVGVLASLAHKPRRT